MAESYFGDGSGLTAPCIVPISSEYAEAVELHLVWARERFRFTRNAGPVEVLLGVERSILRSRRRRSQTDEDDVLGLGVLVGDAYVRGLGWVWAEAVSDEDDEGGVIVVTSPDRGLYNRPMVWVSRLVDERDSEIAIVLNYNMVQGGNCPPSNPAEPCGFE